MQNDYKEYYQKMKNQGTKGRGLGYLTYFQILGPPRYLWNGWSYELQIWCAEWLQGVLPTRKRAIAKALQLKGHPTSRQSIWRIISILWVLCFFFVRKYCVFRRFGKFRLATSHAEHVAPRPLLNVK